MKGFPYRDKLDGIRSERELFCGEDVPLDVCDLGAACALFTNSNHFGFNIYRNHAPEVCRHRNGNASRTTRKVDQDTGAARSCGVPKMG